jgi:hypothetical protein
MKEAKKNKHLAVVFPFLFLLSSCLGVSADITLNQNGSGTVTLEYQISQSLDSLGRLDGNERWNTIPVGRADFERTLDRLSGMRLVSFSSRDAGRNLVIRAQMEFENINALLSFMDAVGRRSSFSGDENSGSLVFSISDGSEATNHALYMLIREISESYSVRMSMSFPRDGRLIITDNQGNHLTAIPGSEISASGRRVFFSFPLYEVLSSRDGINAEFRW